MTLATEAAKTTVLADGITRTFTYSFRIPSKAEADLYLRDEFGAVTLLDPATWSITGTGVDSNGGTFTYPLVPVTVLPAGNELTLTRDVPYTQTTQLTNQSSYSPRTVERGLDRLDMQVQQLAEGLDRAIRVNVTDGPVDDLASLLLRKGKVVGFDPVTGDLTLLPVPPPASGSEPDGYANVKDYGAIGDSVTDDTAAFLAAAATGLSLWVPPGTYKITDTITFSFTGQGMVGLGQGTSVILPQGNGFDAFLVTSGASGAVLRDFGFNGLYMDDQWMLHVVGTTNTQIERVGTNDGPGFIFAEDTSGLGIFSCSAPEGFGQQLRLNGATLMQSTTIRDCNFSFSGGGEAALHKVPVQIDGNVRNTLISGLNIVNGKYGLWLTNSVGAPNGPTILNARDLVVLTPTEDGVRIDEGASLVFLGCQADESATASGVYVGAAIVGMIWNGNAQSSRRYGIEAATGATQLVLDLTACSGNGLGPQSIPDNGNAGNVIMRGSVDQPVALLPGVAVTGDKMGFGAQITPSIGAGQITGATINRKGAAYRQAPTLQVVGDGAGATATCTVSDGGIATATITAPGAGYTWAIIEIFPAASSCMVHAWLPNNDNVWLEVRADGTGAVILGNDRGDASLVAATNANGVNYVQTTGTATGVAPRVEANGSDTNISLILAGKGTGGVVLAEAAGRMGVYGATPAAKGAVTGAKGGNVALANLLTYLATRGLLTDSTT